MPPGFADLCSGRRVWASDRVAPMLKLPRSTRASCQFQARRNDGTCRSNDATNRKPSAPSSWRKPGPITPNGHCRAIWGRNPFHNHMRWLRVLAFARPTIVDVAAGFDSTTPRSRTLFTVVLAFAKTTMVRKAPTAVIARLDRAIQYAAASRLKHRRLWNTGSPAFACDDTAWCGNLNRQPASPSSWRTPGRQFRMWRQDVMR